MNRPIYLDHNATTPLDPLVAKVMEKALYSAPKNPSSVHTFGREGAKIVRESRDLIASFLKKRSDEIFFTSGGTEGINFLIRGLVKKRSHILSTKIEHAATTETLYALEKEGHTLSFLPTDEEGHPKVKDVEKTLSLEEISFIVLSAANGETGVKIDLEGVADVARRYGIPLIIDGVALLGKEHFTIPEGVTGMAFSGHKVHGPQGVGCLYLKKGTVIKPLLYGGGQEKGKRGGTENLLGILGLAKAISLLNEVLPAATFHMQNLRDHFEHSLVEKIKGCLVNGKGERIPNTSNIAFPVSDGELLLSLLDLNGVYASHGSACSSGSLEPSRVLLEMGLPKDRARRSIRFSLSRMTTKEEIEEALLRIEKVVNNL